MSTELRDSNFNFFLFFSVPLLTDNRNSVITELSETTEKKLNFLINICCCRKTRPQFDVFKFSGFPEKYRYTPDQL